MIKPSYFTRLALLLLVAFGSSCGSEERGERLSDPARPQVADPAPSGPSPAAVLPSFTQLARRANPSVVNISAERVLEREGPFGSDTPFGDFLERFFRDSVPQQFRQTSLGSGFVIDGQGLILTSSHVVAGTDEIEVTLWDGSSLRATVVGKDPMTDLAVLRTEGGEGLVPLPLGNSEDVQVGQWVMAIGSPFGLGNTVTAGIVSAKYRQVDQYNEFIQTDAPINPGNSGGPLLNMRGEVIGINSAILSKTGGNVGIGFAIPINAATAVLPRLRKGNIDRGWLGLSLMSIDPRVKRMLRLEQEKGALVAGVTSGGPAETAGVLPGDVITGLDREEVGGAEDFTPKVVSGVPGTEVRMEIVRNGRKMEIVAVLGNLDSAKQVR